MMNQIGGHRWQPIGMVLGPTVFDREVLTLNVTDFFQPLPKPPNTIGVGLRRTDAQIANHWHARLLRTRSKRPCRSRSSNSFNEDASSHPRACADHAMERCNYSRDLRPAKWGSGIKFSEPPMSALGQKRTSKDVRAMSALPPKADIRYDQGKARIILAPWRALHRRDVAPHDAQEPAALASEP